MRSFTSAVAVILGLLLGAVAVPAMWLDRNIVQEDGFVRLAAPLGTNPEFQEQLAAATVSSLDLEQFVPEPLQPVVQQLLDSAVQSLSGLPGYAEAWEETLRRSHRLSFADPSALPAEAGPATSLTLDVAPLVGLVTTAIGGGLGLDVEAPEQTLVNVGEADQRQIIERITTFAPLGYPLAVGAVVAFLLGLLAARRRWTVLLGTGAGLLVLAAVWTVGAGLAEGAVLGRASGNEVAELFKNEFAAAASASFAEWVQWVLIAGSGLLAVALLVRIFSGRRRRTSP
ncbi:hypothetical protein V1638_02095 [Pseudarthrobacter sp. J64]|uniref:hypothetical protein n=1 Tax=Pseudarthrobacter sp. J64 TaxID=3116485 RepID=UPI002E80F43F|nr:hypothetical protein [Pseudarthrobacter sp. J64]MEE2568190.1 hypothetical protein [Pseudarthrobacter sp. J64]